VRWNLIVVLEFYGIDVDGWRVGGWIYVLFAGGRGGLYFSMFFEVDGDRMMVL
jgi:hypothetical protein